MDNISVISERLANLQTIVAQMRVNYKNLILNREMQNKNIELDILERTEIIPVHKIHEISVSEIKLNEPVNQTFSDVDIDMSDLRMKIKELKRLIKGVTRQNQCPNFIPTITTLHRFENES